MYQIILNYAKSLFHAQHVIYHKMYHIRPFYLIINITFSFYVYSRSCVTGSFYVIFLPNKRLAKVIFKKLTTIAHLCPKFI